MGLKVRFGSARLVQAAYSGGLADARPIAGHNPREATVSERHAADGIGGRRDTAAPSPRYAEISKSHWTRGKARSGVSGGVPSTQSLGKVSGHTGSASGKLPECLDVQDETPTSQSCLWNGNIVSPPSIGQNAGRRNYGGRVGLARRRKPPLWGGQPVQTACRAVGQPSVQRR